MNGNRSLSFLLPKSDVNTHVFDTVEEESLVEYDGHKYRIKSLDERLVGQTSVKIVTAPHTFFDLVDEYRYTTLTNGTKSMSQVLAFIFDGTNDWTFSVIDAFDTVEFEDFGNANCLDLFSKVLDRYGAEYDLIGTDVKIYDKVGSTIDLQFRYNHNVKTFRKSLDTSNLSTYIKGTGKRNEDGTYVVQSEYTSPNASIFGIKHAPPYSNESITQLATLNSNIQRVIVDAPEISIDLEFVVLIDAGYTKSKPGLGDTVPTIYEPLGDLNLDLRVMEIEEYPESNKAPKVTLATVRKSLAKASFSYQKALLDKIYDENSGRLRYNVYDEAVKRATEALNNSLTELEYPAGMGILARDPANPNRFVALRSAGLGVTKDGGITFPNAITADGVTTSLLTAGQIKTNNIQIIGNDNLFYWDETALMAIDPTDPNKYVQLNSSGFIVKKGMIEVERADGFKTIIGGRANFDQNVFPRLPMFTKNSDVLNERVVTNSGTNEAIASQFSFTHTQRFLKFEVHLATETSGTTTAFVEETNNTGVWLSSTTSTAVLDSDELKILTVDLGVPAGVARSVYVKFKTNTSLSRAFISIVRYYQSDF